MLFSMVKSVVDFRQLRQFDIDEVEQKLIENSNTEQEKQRIAKEREKGRMKNLIEKDGAFADGIGNGLGYVFTSLEKNFQTEILNKAVKNSELTRGLGMGFGRAFTSLHKLFQVELFTKCETDHEFAMGLGLGFGIDFPYLQQDLRTVVFNKADNNNEFAYGLGVYPAFFFTSLPLDLQKDIFDKAEKNPLFARGIGLGFGYVFEYLPGEFQKELFAKATINASPVPPGTCPNNHGGVVNDTCVSTGNSTAANFDPWFNLTHTKPPPTPGVGQGSVNLNIP
jgi:hypothetical protein